MARACCVAVIGQGFVRRGAIGLAAALALTLGGLTEARAQSAPLIYVPNINNNNISILDTATNAFTGSNIAVGTGPFAVTVRGDQSLVYVANLSANTVSVIDTATNMVTATIAVGTGPVSLTVSPDGTRAYVANGNSNTVSVINTATNTVTATISIANFPDGVVVSPDGSRVYVVSATGNTVSVINAATNTVTTTITAGNAIQGLSLTPDGTRVYTANGGDNTVSVIDTATNTVISTIPVGNAPQSVVVSPDGTRAYVVNGSSNTVSVINTATNTVTSTISVGAAPQGITLSPDGSRVYVTNTTDNTVSVINTASNTVIATLAAGNGPEFLAACGNGNALLATGSTFKANTSGALGCTGAGGPVFTGGTMKFAGANISSGVPITLMVAGGTFDTAGNNATLSGTISGAGGLTKIGAGTLTLSGAGTYFGPTFVNAGTLQAGIANAFSPNSNYTIASGATLDLNGFSQTIGGLTGTGAVINSGAATPTLTMANGAIFAPGNGTPGSSMAVAANVAFQSGAIYQVQVNPSTASFATISGSATLGGASVSAVFASGSYISKRYTILTATGGVSGAFASTVANTNLPTNFHTALSYDANNAYLNLALNFTAPNFGNGLPGNQQAVGNALINFFNATGGIPVVYGTLTQAGLSQASGESATGSQQTTFQAMGQFMGAMTDPFAGRGGGINGATSSMGYAEEGQASAYAASRPNDAYAMFTKAPPAPFVQRWSVWASGFGGSQATGGNAALGSNDSTSRIAGTAVGADYQFSPDTLAGFALAGGGTNFSTNNLGWGRSDLFQAGAYLRHSEGNAYISGALAYGWQDVTTNRIVTIAGLDQLRAEFNANSYSGRVEGGYRFVAPVIGGIAPYAAGQFTTFDLPAYAETVVTGSPNFALAYGATSVTDTRSELGVRTDKSFALECGVLTLRSRVAWAHDFDPNRAVGATFQSLPGASFVVNGAAQASDSALTTASVEMKWLNGWSAAAMFEGEFSNTTQSYAGKGVVRYAW